MPRQPRNGITLFFPAAIFAMILALPWPSPGGPSILRSIWLTARDVHRTVGTVWERRQSFYKDLNTPRSGEHVLPAPVQEMLLIVRGRGRDVRRYRLSDSLAADNWILQQTVSALWPRRRDPRATAMFLLNSDPQVAGCTLIDQQRIVSLVYCP